MAATPRSPAASPPLDGLSQNLGGPIPLACLPQRDPEGRQEAQPSGIAGGKEIDGTCEEARSRSHVASGDGLHPRSRQSLTGTFGKRQCDLVRGPELDAVAIGPFEVIADDLVHLDETCASVADPGREALVQLRPRRLRERVVSRVANQQVSEAEGVLVGKLRLVGAQQLPPDESRERPGKLGLDWRERLHGAAMEHAPLDRAALEHDSLGGVELVESRGKQCLDRRGHGKSTAGGVAQKRDHLLDEQRIPFRCLEDPRPQSLIGRRAVEEARNEIVGIGRRQRLEEYRRRVELAAAPAGTPVEQLWPRHAEQQDRRVAAQVGDVIDEIEKRLLAPVDVIEHDDERRILGNDLQEHAHRPRDLLDRRHEAPVSEHSLDRTGGGRVQLEAGKALLGLRAQQLLQHLDDRPVRDAFPV